MDLRRQAPASKSSAFRSVCKKIVASFVSTKEHVATIPLQEHETVTNDWYITVCLPEMISGLRSDNPKRRIILHRDNASSHTAHKTNDFLSQENIEFFPPCSPDLSPNDLLHFLERKIYYVVIGLKTRKQQWKASKSAILFNINFRLEFMF
ncbi:hypothetical protein EVAR_25072_1 [Eumeta japonica]|uniref:Mariner Mos1 transposase n=1 Tax=Eumeta variegata TaxID=151549 RepID=A0A4C2AFK7_EUMVA|nr:hypothetical protein EVAR_25072_1 [Eumeta japonica]